MIKKNYDDSSEGNGVTESSGHSFTLRADNELYNEDAAVAHKVVSARRIRLPKNSGEDWEILEDGEVVLCMKGTRFTKPEKAFLRSVGGMKFLISAFKEGNKSVVKLKEKLKKVKL